MREVIEAVADILDGLGAPWRLPSDKVLLVDIDHLRDVPAPERKGLLAAAKHEVVRRSVIDVVMTPPTEGIGCFTLGQETLVARQYSRVLLDEFIEGAEDNRRANEQIHAGRHIDGFARNIRRQCEQIATEIYGSALPAAEKDDEPASPVVYFVSLSDLTLVKIGFTTRLRHRMRAFRTATPADVTVHLAIEAPRSLEAKLHLRFAADRVGREWFRLSDAIKAFIEAEKAKQAAK